jgi:hypothetical protein
MSDLSNVKEINVVNDMAYANKHLANGWVLIAVNSVSATDKSGKTGVSTEYVLGWEDALPSKHVSQDEDKVASKYAPQYDDYGVEKKLAKPTPKANIKPRTITIID